MFGRQVHYSRTLLLLVLAILGLTSASFTSGSPKGTNDIYLPIVNNPLTPIIPDTTNVLSKATTQYLTSVSGDGSVFTFSQMTLELTAVAVGEVIVSEPTPLTPNGFLRKVTAVSDTSGQVEITTIQATIEETIQQGELHIHHVLSPEDVQNALLANGVSLVKRTAQPKGEFFFEIQDVVLYDDDGDSNTTNDQIRANGLITFEQDFDFDLVVQNWQLEQLRFTVTNIETVELEIESMIELASVEQEYEIAHQTFSPIIVWVGWVPVVIVPIITVHVGVDGSVEVGLKTTITEETTVTAGVAYANEEWELISDFDNNFTYTPPVLTAGLTIKGYAGAGLDLLLYGIVGPYAKLDLYLELEADVFATPWWELYGGLEVPVGIKVEVMGHELADYEGFAIGYRVLLAQASTPPPIGMQGGGSAWW